MDILEETDVFLSACQLTQDESNNLVFNGITGCFESKYLADWFVNQINFGWKLWQAAKAQAIPEGFVLVPVDTLEECLDWAHIAKWDSPSKKVDKKIAHHEAIIESAISAQEPAND